MLLPFDHLFSKYRIQSTGVLHIGASVGQEAEAYFKQGITEVIWIEALPELIPRLTERVADFPQMKSTVLEACVSNVSGQEVMFNITSNEGQSSSFLEFGTHAKEHPSVKVIDRIKLVTWRVDELLASFNLTVGPSWFVNIDVQGCELLVLNGMGKLLWDFDVVYTEVNRAFLYKNCCLVGEMDAFLAAKGFVGVDEHWTNHGWGDKAYVRKSVLDSAGLI